MKIHDSGVAFCNKNSFAVDSASRQIWLVMAAVSLVIWAGLTLDMRTCCGLGKTCMQDWNILEHENRRSAELGGLLDMLLS